MSRGPSLSVIIPVVNEAEAINRVVEDLIGRSFDGRLEIIVVDGSPAGDTLRAIGRAGVTKVLSEKGRARQMNRGAAAATGDILLFLHADTSLPASALDQIVSVMGKDRCVGGAFDLGIDSGKTVFRVIERVASLRARITRIPFGDQAIFLRRRYFEEMGGYKEIPLMEDVELMKRIKRRGDPVYIVRRKVRTSPRRWEQEGILSCTLRNWVIRTLYNLGVPAEKVAAFYK